MPIDAQEFGRMQAELAILRRDNDRLLELVERLAGQIDGIEKQLSEARGGWRTLVFLGGAAASLGGFVSWGLTHFSWRS